MPKTRNYVKGKNYTRVSINIDNDLLEKIDSFCNNAYVNRTSGITYLLSSAIDKHSISEDFFVSLYGVKNKEELYDFLDGQGIDVEEFKRLLR